MLCNKRDFVILSCNKQLVEIKDRKVFSDWSGGRWVRECKKKNPLFSQKIVSNFSGLFGFIGVDILLDEGTWYIVEVNSRFTSSLIGLEKPMEKK